jgi:drug/metabolite transporter (DMT)-like permease
MTAIGLVFAAVGAMLGAIWGARSGDRSVVVPAGFAGGLTGLFAAAIGYALIKSVESLLGSWSTSLPAVLVLWALIGAAIAALSWLLHPPDSTRKSEPTP